MTDKRRGDSGIRLQKEIAMGKKVSIPSSTVKYKKGGAVEKSEEIQYQKYGSGYRKLRK